MNLRAWVRNVLLADEDVVELVGDRVFSGGTIDRSPADSPFVVITFFPSDKRGPGRVVERVLVWGHDRSSSYDRIDKVLAAARRALVSEAGSGPLVGARWSGNSEDTFDEAMNTRTRYAAFDLAVREDAL